MMRVLIAVVAVVVAGCTSPSAEACRIAQEGPSNAVSASLTADESAGDVSAERTRHDVTLVALTGGNGGSLQLDSEGGRHIIYQTKTITLAVKDAAGTDVVMTSVEEQECAEVVSSNDGVLPAGQLFINLGPSPESDVSLIVLAAADDDDDGDSDSD
jgi:hypothetical protein